MLIFPLKKQWYEKIKSGEKTVEYREVKLYWIKRINKLIQQHNYIHDYNAVDFSKVNALTKNVIFKIPMRCYLQLGYNPDTRLKADITKIETINGKDTDLAIDKPVYAIHLGNIKEVTNDR